MKIKGVGWWKVLSYTLVQNVTEVVNLVKPVLLWMEALQSWTIQSHQDRNVSSEHKGDYSQQLWTDLQSHLPVLETMLTKCTPLYNIWK